MEYTVKIFFNGIHWDSSYTKDKKEAEKWKEHFENTGLSIWDRVNRDALEEFIKEFNIKDAEGIKITTIITEN